jgi:lipopolysaccharide transport protein LptA
MDRRRQIITALSALVVIGFFVWALLPKDNFSEKVSEKLKMDKQKADVVFKDATLSEVYDGIKYWELIAKTAVINQSLGVANLSAVDGLFFDRGRPTIKFLAPSAVWQINKNEILLNDPIGYDVKFEKFIKDALAKAKDLSNLRSVFHLPEKVGKKYEGFWFSAKNLNWKLSTKKLICSGAISLTKGDVIIDSEKLDADVGLEKVLLTGHPSGNLFTDSRKINITADKFMVDSYQDMITADQNVIIKRNGSKIAATKAVYDQKQGLFKLYGGVSLTDGKITAYSKTASYDTKSNKIILTEGAKAKRDENEVFGDKMSILLGQNRVIIEGRTKARIKETEIQ